MSLSKEYILTLLKTPKIGQVSAKAINSNLTYKISSVSELMDLIIDTKSSNSKIPMPSVNDLIAANDLAKRVLDDCERKGVEVITVNDKLYPIKLMRLSDYPIIIYVRGSIDSINSELTAAVIGTREPSAFGLKAGRRVASILGRNGFTIISGLAIGCDTVGHLGALDVNTPTVAVLASGVNIIYPKENQYLADKIVDTGGALFSEYELNFRPQKSSFVERDRLQAGLSNGLVVVETDIKGGTMHTVGFAQKMKMPIGCISNHPESLRDFPKINGNKFLISNGASSLGNPEEIFDFIKKMSPNAHEFINDEKVKTVVPDEAIDEKSKLVNDILEKSGQVAEATLNLIDKGVGRGYNIENVENVQTASSIELADLKELMLKLLNEQQTTNTLLKSFLTQTPKEKTPKKTSKTNANQPNLL